MKNILLTLLIFGFSFSSIAQEKVKKEKEMYFELDYRWRDINGWFKSVNEIDKNSDLVKNLESQKGVFMFIPKDHKFVAKSKGVFMKVYLFNFTNDTIIIPRIDATIGNLETKVEKDNKWYTLHTTFGAWCGNSYGKMELLPNQYILFHSDITDRPKGDKIIKMKLQISINDLIIESNLVEIKTFKGLYDRLEVPIKQIPN